MRNWPAMKRGVFPEEKMKDAVHDLIENQRSTRSVSKDVGVNQCTLGRYVKDATRNVDTEDRCRPGRYVKDTTRSVDTEDRCTLGRYVKDTTGSVNTED